MPNDIIGSFEKKWWLHGSQQKHLLAFTIKSFNHYMMDRELAGTWVSGVTKLERKLGIFHFHQPVKIYPKNACHKLLNDF